MHTQLLLQSIHVCPSSRNTLYPLSLQGTPDDWVPRHPELVRLTGRHPFNVEPPVWRIVDHGFISPNELHYVRNHGAVPRITDGDSHTVSTVKRSKERTFISTSFEVARNFAIPTAPHPFILMLVHESILRYNGTSSWSRTSQKL